MTLAEIVTHTPLVSMDKYPCGDGRDTAQRVAQI